MRFAARSSSSPVSPPPCTSRPPPLPTACGWASTTTRVPLGHATDGGDGQSRGEDARIIRTVVNWANVARQPATPSDPFDPAYNLEDVDELVRNAQQRGIEVLITIWGTPKWANGGQTPEVAPTQHERLPELRARRWLAVLGPVPGYPYVRFSRSGTSRTSGLPPPQFEPGADLLDADLRAARRRLHRIKTGHRSALVAIGETSSHGRDHPRELGHGGAGHVREGVASRAEPRPHIRRLGAAPVSVPPRPRSPRPAAATRSHVEDVAAVRNRPRGRSAGKRPRLDHGVRQRDEAGRAGRGHGGAAGRLPPAGDHPGARDARVGMFVSFVMQDSNGSLCRAGSTAGRRPEARPAPLRPRRQAPRRDERQGHVKGGTKNPLLTVYLREYCANNATGTTVGHRARLLGAKLVSVNQGAAPARDRLP